MTKAIDSLIADLTDVQREAIRRSVFIARSWGLSTWNEDHPDIVELLHESIADPVSGELSKVGIAIRERLAVAALSSAKRGEQG